MYAATTKAVFMVTRDLLDAAMTHIVDPSTGRSLDLDPARSAYTRDTFNPGLSDQRSGWVLKYIGYFAATRSRVGIVLKSCG